MRENDGPDTGHGSGRALQDHLNRQQTRERGQFGRRYAGYGEDDYRGPHAGKGPKGYVRSDERIKDDLCDCLTVHSHLDASGIEVEIRNGEVSLKGTVPDAASRRRAEAIAENCSGVRNVRNELQVVAE
jgi:osmotically-inducible protein OsmY